jgi:hypothetical protein
MMDGKGESKTAEVAIEDKRYHHAPLFLHKSGQGGDIGQRAALVRRCVQEKGAI